MIWIKRKSIKLISENNINKFPCSIVKLLSHFMNSFIYQLFSYFCKHIQMPSFIFIERFYIFSKSIHSLFYLFYLVSLKCWFKHFKYLGSIRELRFYLSWIWSRGFVNLLKFYLVILSNSTFNFLCFINKILQFFNIINHNLSLLIFCSCCLFLQLNSLEHINLLLEHIINQ